SRILCWLTISGQGLIVSRFSARDDVRYPVTARHHLPRDEPAVAAKPDEFRAYDAGRRTGDQTFEAAQPGGKRGGGHVSLVAARRTRPWREENSRTRAVAPAGCRARQAPTNRLA